MIGEVALAIEMGADEVDIGKTIHPHAGLPGHSEDKQQHLFLGPDGGSMTLASGTQIVQVISTEAPLAKAMLGKGEGDEVSILAPVRQQFEVLRVY
jgi:transcription elongation GreA/GreB family factor